MDDENSVEFDLAELLVGNVDSVTAKLAQLPDAQLAKLRELENADKHRVSLIAAIDAETAKRAAPMMASPGPDAMASTEAADAPQPLSFSHGEVDKLLAEQKAKLDRAHAAELAKLKALMPKATGKPGAPSKPLVLASGDLADVLSSVTKIMFVDSDARPLDGLPALSFAPDDYRRNGERLILDREVEFPQGAPGRDVAGAFVLDGRGHPIAYARLVQPFRVGGGGSAKLPPNTLSFEGASAEAAT